MEEQEQNTERQWRQEQAGAAKRRRLEDEEEFGTMEVDEFGESEWGSGGFRGSPSGRRASATSVRHTLRFLVVAYSCSIHTLSNYVTLLRRFPEAKGLPTMLPYTCEPSVTG